MHDVTIPKDVRERIFNRRGRFHIFESINPARTAVVVVDMQGAFMDPGAAMEVPQARTSVANINQITEAARTAGCAVAWLKMTAWGDGATTSYPIFYSHIARGAFGERLRVAVKDGSPSHEIGAALNVAPTDLNINKTMFSGFFPGSSLLDSTLRALGVDSVIIVGTLTNRCCETTASDAMNLGYKVIFVEDACAAMTDAEHQAALVNVATAIGDVRTTKDAIALLQGDEIMPNSD